MSSQNYSIQIDPTKSLKNIFSQLIDIAVQRQSDNPSSMAADILVHYLVAAQLSITCPDKKIKQNKFLSTTEFRNRTEDFIIGDTVIHIAIFPTESLLYKCCINLAQKLKVLIITSASTIDIILKPAKDFGIADRIDIFEIEQYIATGILKHCTFTRSKHSTEIHHFLQTYNQIIEQTGTHRNFGNVKITVTQPG